MSHDPRQTMFVIESVDSVVREWTTVFSLSEERMRDSVSAASQSVENFAGRTRGLLAEAESHQQIAAQTLQAAIEVRNEALECKASADKTISDANSASSRASAMLHAWQSALAEARRYWEQVKQQLMSARQNLSQAEAIYSSAQSEEYAAAQALRSCQNSYVTDSKGQRVTPNCSGQYVRLSAAQSRVASARSQVIEWQGHVSRWQTEEAKARSLVANREAGVARAGQARSLAESALQAAASAERFARDGITWADSAASGADKVTTLASETHAMAEAAVLLGKSALDHAEVMERGSRKMSDVVSEHTNHAGRAGILLTDAFDALREFDRPGGL